LKKDIFTGIFIAKFGIHPCSAVFAVGDRSEVLMVDSHAIDSTR
jgi:hypothetical protein